jgi:hypothetical protein
LRHTFGSLLIPAGASLAYVRDQRGHSSIQITVDIYGHLIPGANIAFVDRLDSLTTPQQSAIQPQQSSVRDFGEIQQLLKNEWLGRRDSNPDTQIQSRLERLARSCMTLPGADFIGLYCRRVYPELPGITTSWAHFGHT